jgi:FAD/FMN-containing dehydrogenase
LLWRAQVEAGVTTRHLRRLAAENGLYYPVDPGAAEQSHMGGNVATNAGGPHAFKYGVTGAWVTGLEAVLASGEVVRVGGRYRKDVAGYDLVSLLTGSEGTLAVVTAVNVRLIPAVEARYPVAAFFDDVSTGCRAITSAMSSGVTPAAIEYLDDVAVTITRAAFPGERPPDAAMCVLVEADGFEHEAGVGRDALLDAVGPEACFVYAPQDAQEISALWRWRDGIGIAVDSWIGGKVSDDIAVPLDRLEEAITGTVDIGRRHQLPTCSWGHAGDGNLHSTFLVDRSQPAQLSRAALAADDLFALAVELGGTISGEHGIGLVKGRQLHKQWDDAAIRLHVGLKTLFDPDNCLNPGKKAA